MYDGIIDYHVREKHAVKTCLCPVCYRAWWFKIYTWDEPLAFVVARKRKQEKRLGIKKQGRLF